MNGMERNGMMDRWMAGSLACWLPGCLAGWLAGRVAGWVGGWRRFAGKEAREGE